MLTIVRTGKWLSAALALCFAGLPAPAAAHYTCPNTQMKAGVVQEPDIQLNANDLGVPDIYEIQSLSPDPAGPEQDFGRGLALQGNTLAIAVDDASDVPGGGASERIDLFAFENGLWQKSASVSSPNAHAREHFLEVDLEEELMIVGASGHCASAPASQCNGDNGAAYLFERKPATGNSWAFIKQLNGGFKADARFGTDLDLDGDTVAVAAVAETINSVGLAGAVYIFERNQEGANQWGLVKRIESDAQTKVEGDFFGSGVTLHGDTLLLLGDDGSVLYEYSRNHGGADSWGLVQKVPVPNGIAQFAFDGETLAFSIMDPCVPIEERKVWLAFYSRDDDGVWRQEQLIEGNYDPFRIRDIALEGNTLIGHTQDYDSAGYVFERSGHPELWALKGVLQSSMPLQLRYGRIALADRAGTLLGKRGHPAALRNARRGLRRRPGREHRTNRRGDPELHQLRAWAHALPHRRRGA